MFYKISKHYITRRGLHNGNFYNNSNCKIGKQKLNCKLKCIYLIKFAWLEMDLSESRLRILLKDTFFSYLQPDEV